MFYIPCHLCFSLLLLLGFVSLPRWIDWKALSRSLLLEFRCWGFQSINLTLRFLVLQVRENGPVWSLCKGSCVEASYVDDTILWLLSCCLHFFQDEVLDFVLIELFLAICVLKSKVVLNPASGCAWNLRHLALNVSEIQHFLTWSAAYVVLACTINVFIAVPARSQGCLCLLWQNLFEVVVLHTILMHSTLRSRDWTDLGLARPVQSHRGGLGGLKSFFSIWLLSSFWHIDGSGVNGLHLIVWLTVILFWDRPQLLYYFVFRSGVMLVLP